MLARSPDRKRAEQYLAASGAVPIWLTSSATEEVCTIHTGSKITGTVAARWWITAAMAPRVASAARRLAGPAPDVPAATASLARSAASLGAVLTADDIAVSRASAAVIRLDAMLEQMRRSGQLAEFNSRYKRGRAAALAEGRGFMAYAVAMKRLKAALVPVLQSGAPMRGVFDEVFR